MLRHYFDALIRQGDYEKVTDIYWSLPRGLKKVTRQGSIADQPTSELMIAMIHQNHIAELLELIKEWGDQGADYLAAAYAYRYIYPTKHDNPFFQGVRAHLNDFLDPSNTSEYRYVARHMNGWDSRAFAYYVIGDYQESEKNLLDLIHQDLPGYFDSEISSFWNHTHDLWVEGMLGCVYAQQRNERLVLEQLEKLDRWEQKYQRNFPSPFFKGMVPYLKARIYAIGDDKAAAVAQLKEAIDQGRMYIWRNITFDLDFVNLKGYPPFEVLISPKKEDDN